MFGEEKDVGLGAEVMRFSALLSHSFGTVLLHTDLNLLYFFPLFDMGMLTSESDL